MKSVLIGIVLMIAISVVAWQVLDWQATTSADAFRSSPSVRLN